MITVQDYQDLTPTQRAIINAYLIGPPEPSAHPPIVESGEDEDWDGDELEWGGG